MKTLKPTHVAKTVLLLSLVASYFVLNMELVDALKMTKLYNQLLGTPLSSADIRASTSTSAIEIRKQSPVQVPSSPEAA